MYAPSSVGVPSIDPSTGAPYNTAYSLYHTNNANHSLPSSHSPHTLSHPSSSPYHHHHQTSTPVTGMYAPAAAAPFSVHYNPSSAVTPPPSYSFDSSSLLSSSSSAAVAASSSVSMYTCDPTVLQTASSTSLPGMVGDYKITEPPSSIESIKAVDLLSQPEIFASVSIGAFSSYVQQCATPTEGGFDQFDIEMEVLSQLCATPEYTAKVYKCPPQNLKKNRYVNVLPNADYRVRLGTINNDPTTDYINASYVIPPLDGCKTKYIAAQAPFPATFQDWWRMIWEQNTAIIVMLTKEREKDRNDNPIVKAHRYWPDEKGKSLAFGPFVITMLDKAEKGLAMPPAAIDHTADSTTDIVLRQFSLYNVLTKSERKVDHLQYVGWPDHGVPDESSSFPNLFHLYRQLREKSLNADPKNPPGPILLHCSAGIGRTGTFCTVDIILDNLAFLRAHTSSSSSSSSSSSDGQLEGQPQPLINVFNIVRALRESRPGMVQSKAQYEFCFRFLDYCINHKLYNVA